MTTIKIAQIIAAVELDPDDIAEWIADPNIPNDLKIIANPIVPPTKDTIKPLSLAISSTN